MEKEIYELFEKKFLDGCSLEERQFLKEIKSYIKKHDDKAKENKNKYFEENLILANLLSRKKIIKTFLSVMISLLAGVGLVESIEVVLENFNIIISDKISLLIVIFVGAVFLTACIFNIFTLERKQNELRFRRYGETWIRHTIALSDYNEEIMKYIYSLEYYKGKSNREQRELFMEKILEVESKNMDKFEKNMNEIQ